MATSSDPATFAGEAVAAPDAGEFTAGAGGVGPRRPPRPPPRRHKGALAFGALFVLLVASALLAPFFASHVAHTTASANHLSDQITVDGKKTDVVSLDGVPIGPQYFKAHGKYFLGADGNGRDVMVRLLYG